MKLMSLLSANVRVIAIFVACLVSSPQLFWWIEIVPLTLIALAVDRLASARRTDAVGRSRHTRGTSPAWRRPVIR